MRTIVQSCKRVIGAPTMFKNPDDATIRKILFTSRTIVIVGCSAKEHRDSNMIARLLIQRGHRVFPVNPNYDSVLGLKCYPDLLSVPADVEMVDVFRRSEFVAGVTDQAIECGAKILWTQLGVYDEEAARRAQQAGLIVVMDRCPAIEYRRLGH